MKLFKFRLQKVLDFRKLKEEKLHNELTLADYDIIRQKGKLGSMLGEKTSSGEAFYERQSGGIKGWEATFHYRFLKRKSREINEKKDVIKGLLSARDQTQKELLSSSIDRKVMEKLKAKAFKKHKTELERREQKQIDEVALQGFRRGKKSNM